VRFGCCNWACFAVVEIERERLVWVFAVVESAHDRLVWVFAAVVAAVVVVVVYEGERLVWELAAAYYPAPTVPARPVTLAPFRIPVEQDLGPGLRLQENQ
jgi:hypothetical protein